MGPLAAVQSLLYSVLIGEFSEFLDFVKAGHLTAERILTVSGNGLLAFGLNVASFETNKLSLSFQTTEGEYRRCYFCSVWWVGELTEI